MASQADVDMAAPPQEPTLEAPAPAQRSKQHKRKRRQQAKPLPTEADVQAAIASHEASEAATSAAAASASQASAPHWVSLSHTAPHRPLLFSPDGRFVFLAAGASVKIYDVATCALLSTLIAPLPSSSTPRSGGKDDKEKGLAEDRRVTCLRFSPANRMQLLVGSMDGSIRVWDYVNGNVLKSIHVGASVAYLAHHESQPSTLYVGTTGGVELAKRKKRLGLLTDKDHPGCDSAVIRLSLKRTNDPKRLLLSKDPLVGLSLSSDGAHLVAASLTQFYVLSTSNPAGGWASFRPPSTLRCIAVHPSQPILATGDAKGAIRLYRPFESAWWHAREKAQRDVGKATREYQHLRPSVSVMHWHAHPVASLDFTMNGAMLMSGGEEGVLVQWQLATGNKDFVPRLGAPIDGVMCLPMEAATESEQPEVAVALADGSLLFVGISDKRVFRAISGLKSDAGQHDTANRRTRTNFPLTFQPGTDNLVLLSSHPSSIQFYSLSADAHLSELEIGPSNRVARRAGSVMEPIRVEHVAFSANAAEWMATYDTWQMTEYALESNLKFWHRDSEDDPTAYSPVTSIANPHPEWVSALAFSPSTTSPSLVTASSDGLIKVWKFVASSKNPTWVCQSQFRYRHELAFALAFSADGSLLAVAHERCVSLWAADTFEQVHVFGLPGDVGTPTSVAFGGPHNQSLVAASTQQTVAWSLLDFSEQFVLHSNAGAVMGLHGHHDIPVVDRRPDASYLLSVKSGKKPSVHATSLHAALKKGCLLPPKQGTSDAAALVYATLHGDVLAPRQRTSQARSSSLTAAPLNVKKASSRFHLFNDIFEASKHHSSVRKLKEEADYQPPAQSSPAAALAQPAHLMPPIKQLWQQAILLPPARSAAAAPSSAATPARLPAVNGDAMDEDEPDESIMPNGDMLKELDDASPKKAEEEVETPRTLHPIPQQLLVDFAQKL